jgi:hypothetical protein
MLLYLVPGRNHGRQGHAKRGNLAWQVDVQPAREPHRQRAEQYLVEPVEIERVLNGRERVVRTDHPSHR